jgi:hypothetical protein
MLSHLGIPVDEERLECAIRFASFEELKKQEKASGFVEKPAHAERFFAVGQKDQWKTDLDPALAEMIRAKMGETMKRYGYLE